MNFNFYSSFSSLLPSHPFLSSFCFLSSFSFLFPGKEGILGFARSDSCKFCFGAVTMVWLFWKPNPRIHMLIGHEAFWRKLGLDKIMRVRGPQNGMGGFIRRRKTLADLHILAVTTWCPPLCYDAVRSPLNFPASRTRINNSSLKITQSKVFCHRNRKQTEMAVILRNKTGIYSPQSTSKMQMSTTKGHCM